MLGPERRSHVLNKKEKEITAYHEAGHALVASVLPYADPVHKISIISRGRAAGYTLKLPLEDKKMQSKKEFLDDIAMSLGGYVAEKTVFGDITTGPSNDLQVLTGLARDMVTRYGMSDKMGTLRSRARAAAHSLVAELKTKHILKKSRARSTAK
jgi:cell division protease FtsH